MEGNDDSDIIEHHVEEDMEKKEPRSHAASSPFLDSVGPSEREARGGTQSSHRLLAYSDALLSIIATVMVTRRAVPKLNTTLLTSANIFDYEYFFLNLQILPVAHTKMEDTEVNGCKVYANVLVVFFFK